MLITFIKNIYAHVIQRDIQAIRLETKKSPYKIFLRVFLLLQFSAIFIVYFIHDVRNGYFLWSMIAKYILLAMPIGLLMSLIVPMRPNSELKTVSISLDKVYLFLIWLLVIAKLLASYYYHTYAVADLIMALIIGLMSGRLLGIVLRVRKLNLTHDFTY